MEAADDHGVFVQSWLDGHGAHARVPELLTSFEGALDRVWTQARGTLGDPTLQAIAGRVLHHAGRAYPALASMKLLPAGFDLTALRSRAETTDAAEVVGWMRFVLTDLLRVLGTLTGEALSTDLHAALQGDVLQPPAHQENRS